jgi:hypothetical protein
MIGKRYGSIGGSPGLSAGLLRNSHEAMISAAIPSANTFGGEPVVSRFRIAIEAIAKVSD